MRKKPSETPLNAPFRDVVDSREKRERLHALRIDNDMICLVLFLLNGRNSIKERTIADRYRSRDLDRSERALISSMVHSCIRPITMITCYI